MADRKLYLNFNVTHIPIFTVFMSCYLNSYFSSVWDLFYLLRQGFLGCPRNLLCCLWAHRDPPASAGELELIAYATRAWSCWRFLNMLGSLPPLDFELAFLSDIYLPFFSYAVYSKNSFIMRLRDRYFFAKQSTSFIA